MQELLDNINKPENIGALSFLADISDDTTLPKEQYDAVSLLGVLGIFDDFAIVIKNLMYLVKRDVAHIFSAFLTLRTWI